jgi:lipopolysaccharide transport system permease protein
MNIEMLENGAAVSGRHSTQSANEEAMPVTVIEAKGGFDLVGVRELWRYRELLFFLTWRDVKVRYKQTVLGAAWAVLQPLAMMIVFTIFFGRVANVPSGGVAYPIFVLCGLIPWFFVSNSITSAAQSIVGNQTLVTKVYFPRLIIPTSAVAAGFLDFLVGATLLAPLAIYYGASGGWHLLWLPFVVAGLILLAVGAGALLAALTVAYRDFRHIVPFMVQLWMFGTPAIYLDSSESFSSDWQLALPLNPAFGLITNFRAAALGTPMNWQALIVSMAVTLVILAIGLVYFRRVERAFADII